MTTNLWTWRGTYFGYRDGDDLWTHNGHHVGLFHDSEVYGRDGRYLGELINDDRLITNNAKRAWQRSSFTPYSRRVGIARYANYAGYAMYAGHQDFPGPESFQ
jgi:hypothetical protein